jgi:predicted ArsR family transcriptional regulator
MSMRTFPHQLVNLVTLLDPRRAELYRYIAAQRDPVSRDQAANALGISRAMAAFHLDKLVNADLLRVEYRRLSGRTGRGAGRPAKLYARSRHRFDVSIPQRDPELLARLLAESVTPSGLSPTRAAAQRYGHLLGVRARRRIGKQPREERLARCVEDVAEELGFEPTRSGHETWTRNCPFEPLSRESPEIVCETALAIVGGVIDGVGTGGIQVARRDRRTWCCVVLTRPSSGEDGQPTSS